MFVQSILDVVFSGFKKYCSNRRDSMIAPSNGNGDCHHPIKIWNVTKLDSELDSLTFYPRANLG